MMMKSGSSRIKPAAIMIYNCTDQYPIPFKVQNAHTLGLNQCIIKT